jgi:hypothetical protein
MPSQYQATDFGRNLPDSKTFRVDITAADPINIDIASGVAQGPTSADVGATYGTVRAATIGRDVVINAELSHAGTVFIEDADGIGGPFAKVAAYGVDVQASIGVRFRAARSHYRCTVQSLKGLSIGRVHVVSQLRDAAP